MQFVGFSLLAFIAVASAQYAAWPSTSYSPYYQSLFAGAASPVLAEPVAASVPYGSLPVAAAPAMAAASVNGYAAAAVPEVAVPAYSPFQNSAYFIGSNKGRSIKA